MRYLKKKLIQFYEWGYKKALQIKYILQTRVFFRLPIMSSEKTIRYIQKHNCSIARYGDGEFSQMLHNYNIGFQSHSDALAQKLQETLCARNDNLLICVPKSLVSVRKCNKNAKKFWLNWGKKNNQQVKITKLLRKHCGKSYRYGDALITRPYMDLESKKHAEKIFPLLKKLWEDRDLLIVEGEQTRLGVGNDLFHNAKSIQRILAPAKNAFASYDTLKKAIHTNFHGQLVLLALGPTATVLAADLSQNGIQAIDIGHIDIEYEWFLSGTKEKKAIEGKFVNEVGDGRNPADCKDEKYLSQIVCKVLQR